jgi:hypothetical protein
MCVLILLWTPTSSSLWIRPLSVLILLYMCPHTAIYCYICVLILLFMCPHTTIYVSSYCYVFVLILLYVSSYCYMCPHSTMCPHTTVLTPLCVLILQCVSSYYYVLILQHMCPHSTMYVSSYCDILPQATCLWTSHVHGAADLTHYYTKICVLILHVSSYCYIRVLIPAGHMSMNFHGAADFS